MKNWFNRLNNEYKLLLIIGLYVATVLFALLNQYSAFFSFFCVACLVFAIIFTVFYSKYKKSNTSQKTHHNFTAPASVPSNSDNPIVQQKKPIEANHLFPKIDGGFYLRWQYKENIHYAQNLDKIKLGDSDMELVPEPDNQYDKNAVALYKGEYKLGYFYKGQTQEMILSYIDRNDYRIETVVCLLDDENNKLAVQIAFYRNLDAVQLETLTVPLVKITKKSEDWGSSRYDNVSMVYVDDYVEITENDDGGYTVCDEYGNELGELNANTAEKVEEFFDDIIYAKIADIKETENDTFKVSISIFYR